MPLDRRVADRFFRVLVEEIRRTRPEYLEKPFTVAEIYQSLVPYRSHRDRIGVEMNADYEEALLQLLGGTEEQLILDSQPARDQIRRELSSSNPNTGLFREFAALTVRLDPEQADRVPVVGVLPGADPGADAHAGPGANPGTPPQSRDDDLDEGTLFGDAESQPEAGPNLSTPDDCPDCGRDLPDRPGLRFCPYCGVDVLVATCVSCGEELDREWAFCVACGTPSGFGAGAEG